MPVRGVVLLRIGLLLTLGAALGFVAAGTLAALLCALAFPTAGAWLVRRRRLLALRVRHDALVATLPDAIDLLASAVDGGVATDVALGRVADFAEEPMRSVLLDAVAHASTSGTGARLCEQDAALRPLGGLLRQSEELGVPVASALRLLAADARARARALARERAAAAAPKLLLVVGGLLAPASLLIVVGGQLLVLRDVAGMVLT